ncbi:hypothetical protein SAMN05421823_106234 [Catalinimonas alkaloidigena]|uniref:Uncharacterized protein n=2 Tax=Catalinimonas alkaloidigena TaxID=1075417 RepID=A0A1G9KR89_9BACT|nr:hypothetical protein SAMN05421823_106234 [Catalinimonas alkaloidigena]
MSNVDLAYEILKAKKEEEIESFFYFFFHEIHPQYKSVPDKFDSIKLTDSKFYNLIAIGHEQAIKDSGH